MANTHSLDLEASSSQYAYVADQAIFDGLSAFSIECWLKFESIADDMMPVTKWGTVLLTTQSWRLITSGGKLQLVICDGVTSGSVTANQTISVGIWYHFAFTWNGSLSSGSRAKAYVNGVDVTSSDGTIATMLAGTAGLYVGNIEGLPAAGYYDGLIDDIRIWNTARTSGEISGNYKSELVGSESGLVGYWKLNNDYQDATANNNDLTASGSPVFSTDTPLDLTDGLVSYWKLDTNSNDSVASNNGTDTNVSYGTSVAKISGAVDTRSTSTSKIIIPDSASWDTGTGNFSMACWAYQTTGTSAAGVFIGASAWTDVPPMKRYHLDMQGTGNTTISFGFYDGTNQAVAIYNPGASLRDGWHHIVGTRTGGVASIYVDGVLRTTASNTLGTSANCNLTGLIGLNIGIGNDGAGNWERFQGYIDEVGFWNRALNADEVTMLYNGGSGFTYPFVTGYTITCLTGTFTLTGVATNFLRGYALVCSAGNFVLTGIDTLFKKGYGILCDVGTFIMTGFDTMFRHSGWTSRTKPSTTFTDRTKPTTTFTDRTKPTTNWTNR